MTQEAMKDILAVLEQNARATPEEISEMTGQTPEEVRNNHRRGGAGQDYSQVQDPGELGVAG